MAYNLIATEHYSELLDRCIGYVVNILKNQEAAIAILDDVDAAYVILEESAESFGFCNDPYLLMMKYRKIALKHHDYLILYKVEDDNVYLAGFFHMREDYQNKL